MPTTDRFRGAILSAGIVPPEVIEADGKLHRFASNGKRSDDAGWYVLHADGIPAGSFGDWRTGISETWRADIGRKLTPAEEAAHQARVEAIRREREAEEARRHAEAREKAAAIWKAAQRAPDDHPYLNRKGVKAHRLRLHDGALVVPMRDAAGTLHSLQFITPEGEKKFLTGGRVNGCYFAIGKPHGALCIAEGYATGASVQEATGYAMAVAFNAGNLEAVAKALRTKFPQARIILCADNDVSCTGQHAAEAAARAVGGLVAIPSESGKDWNDIHRERGAETVRAAIEGAQPVNGATKDKLAANCQRTADAETIARLAALPALEYDRIRIAEAEKLGVRAQTLDEQVRRARGNGADDGGLMFGDLEPWPEPVDGERLLDSLAASCKRFIILPIHGDTALVLWALFTHLIEAADVAPILALLSPEKRCGKTTCVAWLSRLVRRPMPVSNISPAALFRAVEAWGPTLLIDEADSFARENEELRGILNSGHTRATAFVIRCEGDDNAPRPFSTWGAKLIAMIGKLPDTLRDRAITLELRRKLASERVEKLRHAESGEFEALARQCIRFAQDNAQIIRAARPKIPDELHDRAADNWEPLLAIADAAGGKWSRLAREAASVLSGAPPDGDSTKTELLRDIRDALNKSRFAGREYVGSAELLEALTADTEARWYEFSRGKAMTVRQLARHLRPFGIVSVTVRLPGGTAKGYRVESFGDAFARYLPPFDPSQRYNPILARVSGQNASVTEGAVLRIDYPSQPNTGAACDGVTDGNPLFGGGQGVEAF